MTMGSRKCAILLSLLVAQHLSLRGSSFLMERALRTRPAFLLLVPSTTATTTQLHLSKKKSAAPAATKKIQVKMLKTVPGTGQSGDVVLVTPAFFNNKLRPTASAAIISDEQVAEERAAEAARQQEETKQATALQQLLQRDGFSLRLNCKAGPEGQLFGAIHAKTILAALSEEIPEVVENSDDAAAEQEFLSQKKRSVKLTGLVDKGSGKKMRGDIKHVGEYEATVSLTKNISAKFTVVVEAE